MIIGYARYEYFYRIDENHINKYIGQTVDVVGLVKYDPDIRTSNIRITLDVKYIIVSDDKHYTHGSILLVTSRYPVFQYGDIIEVKGELKEPENYNSFDYKEYLRTQNIYSIIQDGRVEKVGELNSYNVLRLLSHFKNNLNELVKKQIPEPESSLLLGIETGAKQNMPVDFSEDLSNTSTTHIIAVSGYNVTILIGAILALAGIIPRKAAIYLCGIILTLFLLLVGINNAPAMRAGIMGYAFLFSLLVGKKGALISFLPLAGAVIIYLNPLAYKTISFQLSFASTLGLILLSVHIEKIIKFLPDIIRSQLAPTLSANIATLPIILGNFGKISLISPVVNIFVLPMVPYIMFLGFIYFITIPFGVYVSFIPSYLVYLLLEYVVKVIYRFGKLDFAYINFGDVNSLIINLIWFILVLLSFKLNVKKNVY